MLILIQLFLMFFKIGIFSFGGGYVMLPLIIQQLESSGLIPMEEFPDLLALSQMTPGPIAINAATYVGYRTYGLIGAIFATLGVIAPAIILFVILLNVVARYRINETFNTVLSGVRPVLTGLIFIAVIYFCERTIFAGSFFSKDIINMGISFFNLRLLMSFIVVLLLAWKTRLNPIVLTLGSGLAAIVLL